MPNDQTNRYEFYKHRGATVAVTTCDCCCIDGYQDAWRKDRKGVHSIGIKVSALRNSGYQLITQKEAMERAPNLLQSWKRK